jgi:hypothetical protein
MLKKLIRVIHTVFAKRDDMMDLANAVFELENTK